MQQRLNVEIDADTHATLSDAARYLRDPPLPPAKIAPGKRASTPVSFAGSSSSVPGRASPTSLPGGRPVDKRHGSSGGGKCSRVSEVKIGRDRAEAVVGGDAKTETNRRSGAVPVADGQRRRSGIRITGAPAGDGRGEVTASVKEARLRIAASGTPRAARSAGIRIMKGSGGLNEGIPSSNAGSPRMAESSLEIRDKHHPRRVPSPGLSSSGVQEESIESRCGEGTEACDRTDSVTGNALENIPAGIGEEATARFLKAKLAACQSQLEEALRANQGLEQDMATLRKQATAEQEQAKRVARQLQQLQQVKNKDTKAKEEGAAVSATLSAKVSELERELGVARRTAKQAETDKKSLEVRLHRALEEVCKQREASRQAKGQNKGFNQEHRLELAKLEGKCQRLEKQKTELMSAFKKQLKLIDVLKRQKFHVEAARLLAFTEEEFVKTLDWVA